jgi:myosin protein heavy chain
MPRYSQGTDAARAAAEQAEFNEKKWVWVPDEEDGYLAGWVVTEDDETAEVQLAGTVGVSHPVSLGGTVRST